MGLVCAARQAPGGLPHLAGAPGDAAPQGAAEWEPGETMQTLRIHLSCRPH